MYEFAHTDMYTDRQMDTGCDIVASGMKQIATKIPSTVNIKIYFPACY